MEIFCMATYLALFYILRNFLVRWPERTLMYVCLRFSSIINSALSLISAKRISESSFAISYKNFLVSFIFAVVFFVLIFGGCMILQGIG
jgi:hypothetical protein